MLLFVIVWGVANSQEIRVVDSKANGIENMAIFNRKANISVLTDSMGFANISKFKAGSILCFQHPSYKKVSFSKREIEDLKSIVKIEDRLIEFDDIIVSAYRWEQNINEVPNKITRISTQEIDFSNSQTSADLLKASGEVFIQKSQLGGGSPMIRGFATNSVLLVVDRVRMNNAIFRSGNLQNVISLDANSIESTEIIFGPGSVTYGSDALGGVMDFHTKRVKLSTSEKLLFHGNALTRYSSANKEKTMHVDFLVSNEKFGALTSYSYSKYEDLLMGSYGNSNYVKEEYAGRINGVDTIINNSNKNSQVHSAYNQDNFIQKFRFRPNANLDFKYGFYYSKTSDIPRYDRLIQYSDDKLKYAEWYYGPQVWMMHSLNAKYSKANLLFDEAELTLAFQDYEHIKKI
jgi:hemoglobin/transferrin/lactoferrin receptor protein